MTVYAAGYTGNDAGTRARPAHAAENCTDHGSARFRDLRDGWKRCPVYGCKFTVFASKALARDNGGTGR